MSEKSDMYVAGDLKVEGTLEVEGDLYVNDILLCSGVMIEEENGELKCSKIKKI